MHTRSPWFWLCLGEKGPSLDEQRYNASVYHYVTWAQCVLCTLVTGEARVLSFDLVSQMEGLDNDGQFRFTPPTHAMLAFKQALSELDREGGVQARATRYRAMIPL